MGFQHAHNLEVAQKALRKFYLKRWHERFEEVKKWVEDNNKVPSPNNEYYRWLLWNKNKYNRNDLDQVRVQLLRSIGYDVTKINNYSQKERNRVRWFERFEEVEKFVDSHHRLPKKEEWRLYQWLIWQRNNYTEGKLDIEQTHLLDSIGFNYKKKRKRTFDQCLIDFIKNPKDHNNKTWRDKILQQYRNGTLSQEKIDKVKDHIDLDRPKGKIKITPELNYELAMIKHRKSVAKMLPLYKQYADEIQRNYMIKHDKQRVNRWRYQMRQLYKNGFLPEDEIVLFKQLKILT